MEVSIAAVLYVLTIAATQAAEQNYVPVLLWTSNNENFNLVSPLKNIDEDNFRNITMNKFGISRAVIVLVAENLRIEDLTLMSSKINPFARLSNIPNRRLHYLARVQNATRVLRSCNGTIRISDGHLAAADLQRKTMYLVNLPATKDIRKRSNVFTEHAAVLEKLLNGTPPDVPLLYTGHGSFHNEDNANVRNYRHAEVTMKIVQYGDYVESEELETSDDQVTDSRQVENETEWQVVVEETTSSSTTTKTNDRRETTSAIQHRPYNYRDPSPPIIKMAERKPNQTEENKNRMFVNVTNIFLYASDNIRVNYKKEVYEFNRVCSRKRNKCKTTYGRDNNINIFHEYLLNLSSGKQSHMISELMAATQTDKVNNSEIVLCATKSRLRLIFGFEQIRGSWHISRLTLADGSARHELLAQQVSAPLGFSYHCYNVTFSDIKKNVFANISGLQVQPFVGTENKFGNSIDCVGFFSPAIMSGLIVSALLLGIVSIGLTFLTSIKPILRFDDVMKTKPLVIIIRE